MVVLRHIDSTLINAPPADGRVFACGMLLERMPIPRIVLPAGKGITQIACGAQYIAAWRGTVTTLPY